MNLGGDDPGGDSEAHHLARARSSLAMGAGVAGLAAFLLSTFAVCFVTLGADEVMKTTATWVFLTGALGAVAASAMCGWHCLRLRETTACADRLRQASMLIGHIARALPFALLAAGAGVVAVERPWTRALVTAILAALVCLQLRPLLSWIRRRLAHASSS